MEPTSRLYQCMLCHEQTVVCSHCDHGQIYCSRACSKKARVSSLKIIRARYQLTFKGRCHHAARQAAYRMRRYQKVTDQGSPPLPQHAPIEPLENRAESTKVKQAMPILMCHFCHQPVSDWLRRDFLRRRGGKKMPRLPPCAQAP